MSNNQGSVFNSKKRKFAAEEADDELLSAAKPYMADLARTGWAAIPIELEGVDELRNGLLKGTGDYFASKLPVELHEPVLRALDKESFDFRDMNTYTNLMDPAWRKTHLEPQVSKAVRKALSGNACAQGKPGRIIARNGFGIFTHLRGLERLVVDYFPQAIQTLQQEIAQDLRPISIGHPIFKPPVKDGGALRSHMDGGTMAEAFEFICQNPDTAIEEWIRIRPHRVQVILHIEGGRNGATNVLAPMTIPRLGFVMGIICPDHLHADIPNPKDALSDLWTKGGAPIMFDWYNKNVLRCLNRVMALLGGSTVSGQEADWIWIEKFRQARPTFYKFLTHYFAGERETNQLHPFAKTDIAPDDPSVQSFLAVWPGQFLHGSGDTGRGTTRLSLTIPSGFGERDLHTDRALLRIENISSRNWEAVEKDTRPYHGGSVHKENIIEVENFEFFEDLYVKPTTDLSVLRSLFHDGPAKDTQGINV